MRTQAYARAIFAGLTTGCLGKRGVLTRLVLLLAAATVLTFSPAALADDPALVVKVQEDWVIELDVPDAQNNAPQIITVMSPSTTLNGHHAVFELNHASMPDYFAGGMQLQLWNYDQNLYFHSAPNTNILAVDNETVTFTMQMSLSAGKLYFEVIDGTSVTWGNFGGQGYLKTFANSSLTNLNGYSPQTSVANSQVGFASNRIKRFYLKEVRYYTSDDQFTTDTTDWFIVDHTADDD